jgi:hypothetical protein
MADNKDPKKSKTRRKARGAAPVFVIPAEIQGAGQSGWVYRSDSVSDSVPQEQVPARMPALPPADIFRPFWMPLAILYSAILALLPSSRSETR